MISHVVEEPSGEDRAQETVVAYRIDSADRIVAVGGLWDEFASAGCAPELAAGGAVGRSLWDYLVDERTRSAYRRLLQRVRREAGTLTLRLRCDAPDLRRSIDLTMTAGPGDEVEFTARTVAEVSREAIRVLDPDAPRSRELVLACGWCHRVLLEGAGWLEIEQVAEELEWVGGRPTPRLSHGMCRDCWEAAVEGLG